MVLDDYLLLLHVARLGWYKDNSLMTSSSQIIGSMRFNGVEIILRNKKKEDIKIKLEESLVDLKIRDKKH